MHSPPDDGLQRHSSKSGKNRKKNRQNYGSKMPNPLSFNSSRADESANVLQMITGETSIYLNDSNAMVYSPSNLSYDRVAICRADIWHQVFIHHNGEFKKNQLLKSFFGLLHEEEFYPIAYREYTDYDVFLLRQSNKALVKLFSRGLKITMPNEQTVSLTVKLNVGNLVIGQVFPAGAVYKAVEERFTNAEMYGEKTCLNFDSFAQHADLQEISVSLSNRSMMELLCSSIMKSQEIVETITSLKLCHNYIYSIAPLESLAKIAITSLDLRNNFINNVQQFKCIRVFNLTELYVAGNPFASNSDHVNILRELFPDLNRLDDLIIRKLDSTNLPKNLRHLRAGDLFIDDIVESVVIKTNSIDLNYFKKFKDSNKWHQIVVHHMGNFEKTQILDALFAQFDTYEFFPCYYKSYAKFDEMFVRKCHEALEILMRNKLILRMPFSSDHITLVLKLNVADFFVGQVDPFEKFATIASENMVEKVLDLDNFHEIPILKNLAVSLSYPACLGVVLKMCAKKQAAHILAIKLRHNNIKSLNGLYTLNWFQKCTSLDLRHNQISQFADFEKIPLNNRITELWLDHNPICNNVGSADAYLKGLRKIFPCLQTLDGVCMPKDTFALYRQNFLCKPEAVALAEDFVKHYFKIYDSAQRSTLKSMYAANAQLTVSITFDQSKIKEKNSPKLTPFRAAARNIMRLTNFDASLLNVFAGPENIMQIINNLPVSEHDFFSFTIDVTSFTPSLVCLTVSGFFKVPAERMLDEDFTMNFTRTFLLRPVAKNKGIFQKSVEYKILNDLLFVTNLTYFQTNLPFKCQEQAKESLIPVQEEKENFLIVFQELTSLGKTWAYKLMEDSSWNMKMALNIFVKLYEENKIPPDAFLEDF